MRLIDADAAIDIVEFECGEWSGLARTIIEAIKQLPSAQPDNQIHLCDSCDYSYPDCPSKNDDVIFGNGIGNDNICACNKYKPSAQPMRIRARWLHSDDLSETLVCSACGYDTEDYEPYASCPNCGAKMEEEE